MTARILPPHDGKPAPAHVLSFSTASVLIHKSPLHARLRKLREVPDEPTEEMDLGAIVHELLLSKGRGFAVAEYTDASADAELAAMAARFEEDGEVPPIDAAPVKKGRAKKPPEPPPIAKESGKPEWQNWLRGDAKAARDAIRAKGLVAILPKHKRMAEAGAKKIRTSLAEQGFVLSGESEVGIEWSEFSDDGDEVTCWGALDHLVRRESSAEILDLKIVESAHPRAAQRHLLGFGGYLQAEAYIRAVEALYPELAGRVSFTFLFCELYSGAVTPVRLGGGFRKLGEMRWRRAVNTWARCLREDTWPGYVTGTTTIDAPQWAIEEETTEQINVAGNRGEAFLEDT